MAGNGQQDTGTDTDAEQPICNKMEVVLFSDAPITILLVLIVDRDHQIMPANYGLISTISVS